MIEQKKAKSVGIGLVGSGFMGRCHANAFRSVAGLFDLALEPSLNVLADANDELQRKASVFRVEQVTGDVWSQMTPWT